MQQNVDCRARPKKKRDGGAAFIPNENNFTPIFGRHALEQSIHPGLHLAKEYGEVETFIS